MDILFVMKFLSRQILADYPPSRINPCSFQDRSGSVSVGEFLSVPELKENPLVKRVVDVFDDDLSGEVDFKGKRTFTLIDASSNDILTI